jgi:hypothetical protein
MAEKKARKDCDNCPPNGCEKCSFKEVMEKSRLYCKLAHEYVDDLGRFCPQNLTPQELQQACELYQVDGTCKHAVDEGYEKELCLCRLAEMTATALLQDPDFKAKEGVR